MAVKGLGGSSPQWQDLEDFICSGLVGSGKGSLGPQEGALLPQHCPYALLRFPAISNRANCNLLRFLQAPGRERVASEPEAWLGAQLCDT